MKLALHLQLMNEATGLALVAFRKEKYNTYEKFANKFDLNAEQYRKCEKGKNIEEETLHTYLFHLKVNYTDFANLVIYHYKKLAKQNMLNQQLTTNN